MTTFYKINTTFKSILFTSMVYGWFIPTLWVADQMKKLFPTHNLDSENWIIEEGVPNTSWDLVSIDASLETENTPENEEVETSKEDMASLDNKPVEDKVSQKVMAIEKEDTPSDTLNTPTQSKQTSTAQHHTQRNHPTRLGLQTNLKSRAKTKRTARTGKCNAKNPDIEKHGRMAYSVPKRTVKHYSTHWKQASRLAHLSWAMNPDGSRLGVRIRAISCRSPLKFTGLKRGDVVITINGHSVQSEKDLLKVYGKLLFWKKMNVEVKRGKKLVTLQYDIV